MPGHLYLYLGDLPALSTINVGRADPGNIHTIRLDTCQRPREAEELAARIERMLGNGDHVHLITNDANTVDSLPTVPGSFTVFACEGGTMERWTDAQATEFFAAVAVGIEHISHILQSDGIWT